MVLRFSIFFILFLNGFTFANDFEKDLSNFILIDCVERLLRFADKELANSDTFIKKVLSHEKLKFERAVLRMEKQKVFYGQQPKIKQFFRSIVKKISEIYSFDDDLSEIGIQLDYYDNVGKLSSRALTALNLARGLLIFGSGEFLRRDLNDIEKFFRFFKDNSTIVPMRVAIATLVYRLRKFVSINENYDF